MSATVIPIHKDKKKSQFSEITTETWDHLFQFRAQLQNILLGKEKLVDAILCATLAQGHVLLEDVPGVGKTTVIKAISRLLGLGMKRIQCTSDLLPSDIIGVEVFNPTTNEFVFHEGPVFTNVVLADELNRSSPRTQSALLEAMGEGMVTVDRKTYALPKPFIVFAAQNPSDHLGTYPLPESQLDRFSIKICLDYPETKKEIEIFSHGSLDPLAPLTAQSLTSEKLSQLQNTIDEIFISEPIATYVKRFVDATRNHVSVRRGVSTRGGVSWIRMARAKAMLAKRDYVIPDDCMATAAYCLPHRILSKTGSAPSDIIASLVATISIE